MLGLVQGLTEYLPVSSSGHLAIAQHLCGLKEGEENLMFTIAVHVATVLSTLVVLRKPICDLLLSMFKGESTERSEAWRYVLCIVVSMIPVGIVGVCFKDEVETVFGHGLLIVGVCLMVTALLLGFSYFFKPKKERSISLWRAFIIGLAQAVAVLPGLSRSGSTIGTGLILGVKKETLAQFSFLMVIPPILGEALLDVLKMMKGEAVLGELSVSALSIGFAAAFVSGCLACKWMIDLVKRGKMIWFASYCAIAGVLTLLLGVL